jgi:hypothetical protein
MVDVLFSERYGARTQWYISRENGQLLGFDTYRDDDVDPCEVRLDGLVELAGRRLPAVLLVRHADRDYGRFKLEGLKFGPPAAAPAADASSANAARASEKPEGTKTGTKDQPEP